MALHTVLVRFGILFALLAVPVKLVALVIPWWAYTETKFFGDKWKSNIGLWKWCKETLYVAGDSVTSCRSYVSPEGYIVTSRNLVVFGLLLFCLGLVIVTTQSWFAQELVFLGFLGPLIMCIAGALTWTATVKYAEDYVKTPGNQPHDVHAGWMLAAISSLCCCVSGSLFAAGKLCRK